MKQFIDKSNIGNIKLIIKYSAFYKYFYAFLNFLLNIPRVCE